MLAPHHNNNVLFNVAQQRRHGANKQSHAENKTLIINAARKYLTNSMSIIIEKCEIWPSRNMAGGEHKERSITYIIIL